MSLLDDSIIDLLHIDEPQSNKLLDLRGRSPAATERMRATSPESPATARAAVAIPQATMLTRKSTRSGATAASAALPLLTFSETRTSNILIASKIRSNERIFCLHFTVSVYIK